MREWYVRTTYIEKYPRFEKNNYYRWNEVLGAITPSIYEIYNYFGTVKYAVYIDLIKKANEKEYRYTGIEMKVGDKYIKDGIEHEVRSIVHNDDENYSIYIMKNVINENKNYNELLSKELKKMEDYMPEFRKMIKKKLDDRTFWEKVKDLVFN